MSDIHSLMEACYEQGASDLHVSVGRPPVLRRHGHLVEIEGRASLTGADVDAMVAEITPERNQRELEELGSTDYGLAFGEKCRFRVSVLTQKGSRGIVMRQIPQKLLSFEQIGLPEAVQNLLNLHRGLILVTGPTGSGKSTTLATMIDWINQQRDVHIITIEDPIEYYHTHRKSQVTQREVGVDTPTFAEAMRRALRQDPDVILLGEMRDLETTSAAISAAETGHLVFGTLHTTGAARTVDRIIDQYPTEQQDQIRAQLAMSLVAVISQILIPSADGHGRVAGFEVMISNPAIENHIRKTETYKIPSVIQTSRRQGMQLLDDSLLELYRSGRIRREEALERSFDAAALSAKMGGGA
ncbi:MAG: type IV pilus twitching motility protein PilT [Planctomycetota bacterium]|nr:type IV pilus twitching motility protein PilT [Planctomycetota bacterium]MDA0934374.1 type IV pilus twitching motility protein PilT [Planctomycetota bacterium]MDA1221191.1 type IV pilus twitching motility protein PilT [Planctomycetota bacterium]